MDEIRVITGFENGGERSFMINDQGNEVRALEDHGYESGRKGTVRNRLEGKAEAHRRSPNKNSHLIGVRGAA